MGKNRLCVNNIKTIKLGMKSTCLITGLPERLHQPKVHLYVNWLKTIKLSNSAAYKNRLHFAQHLNTYIYSSVDAANANMLVQNW